MVRTSLAPIAAAAALIAAVVSIAQANPDGRHRPVTHYVVGTVGIDTLHAVDGRNVIRAGKGGDVIHLDTGRGRVYCGPGHDVVYVPKRLRKHYRLRRCETILRPDGQL
jgi:hypothetical protein